MKNFLIIFLIFSFWIFSISPSFANNDIEVSSDSPLFSVKNVSPGFVQKKTLKIKNSRNETCNLFINLNQISKLEESFSKKILIQISDNQKVIFNSNLNNFFQKNNNSRLDEIDANSEKEYRVTASLDKNIGNEYQNALINFDMDFNFSCGDQSEVLGVSQDESNTSKVSWRRIIYPFIFGFLILTLMLNSFIFNSSKKPKTR